MSDLIQRLRGIYTVPVNDGAGLLNGKDTFTRAFDVPPIHKEAADRIAELEANLAIAVREVCEADKTILKLEARLVALPVEVTG